MGLPNTVNQLFNGGSPYYIVNRSLRFRSSATAYLNRTATADSNRAKWTFSAWVKRGKLGAQQAIIGDYETANYNVEFFFNASDALEFKSVYAAATQIDLTTSAVFRDPSAWYHIQILFDSAQATAANRTIIYVNGVSQTLTGTQTPLNATPVFITNADVLTIGRYNSTDYFDGYLAEVNFVDGQALTPSSFGVYDTNGIWQPIRYAGTYGTNGFYLPFKNTTSTTTLVADASGNGNNWTPNNISLTAGTTYDSMLDSPTVSNASSNYCVLNPLNYTVGYSTTTNGNLLANFVNSGNSASVGGTISISSGKWYWECIITAIGSAGLYPQIGIVGTTYNFTATAGVSYVGNSSTGYVYRPDGNKVNNGTASAYGATFTTNDVIGVALDLDAGTITFYKNNVSQGTAYTGISGSFIPASSGYASSGTVSVDFNFGQRPFSYTPPSGYNALNTANLPAATISYGAPYMNAVTYTGYGPLIPSGLGIPTKRNASTQNVSKSLRIRSSASAYLNRTPAAAGSLTTMTFSAWVKLSTFNAALNQWIWGAFDDNYGLVQSVTSNSLTLYFSGTTYVTTSAVFRDPSAWYHIVATIDTTDATSTNRLRLYVNGVLQTIGSSAYPAQNATGQLNNNVAHNIGRAANATRYWDGYIAEVNFIDGQALTPSSFGETNSDGVWVPKSYTGTYGTNGFYLPFTNTTSTTTLVADSSGNGNNWTPNNISLTAGTTYDSMIDSPTDYASAANYPVINPLLGSVTGGASYTISQGNLYNVMSAPSTNYLEMPATMRLPTTGKWYWETTVISVGTTYAYAGSIGISDQGGIGNGTTPVFTNNYYYYLSKSGNTYTNGGATVPYGATYTANDVISCLFDADAGTLIFYKNGVSQGTAFTGLTAGPYFPKWGTNDSMTFAANFGQRPFSYTVPTGYSSLNTYNITAPSKTWFSSANNSGRGSATAYPDFVWIKSRSSAQNHSLNDTLRGPTLNLISNSTAAEAGASTMFSVNKYGLTLGNDASVNSSSYTDVMWGWQAGQGTTSTNTSGTITSTVSASAQSGFSIAIYTGTGANATVGHGLGVAPNMVIVKPRVVVDNWNVYHASNSASPATQVLYLNLTNATSTNATIWNNTAPTSSVFSIGTNTGINTNGSTYVAYCFAAVRGYSAFGSYTGNGSSDGPFVFTNFRPRFVMLKRTDAANVWLIGDSSRNGYNSANPSANKQLQPQATNTESNFDIDYLSNGFKLRNIDSYLNASGGTYIYAAFAENPFSIARAR